MNAIRVLLLSSSRLALPTLQQLAHLNMLAGVVIPRQCDEWMENVHFVLGGKSGIPVLSVTKENYASCIATAFKDWNVTLCLMVTFSFRIPASLFQLPVLGFFNVHPGMLPRYRGADPVFQQIKNRETYAGVAVHHVTEGFDEGPVVLQKRIKLHPTDTYGMLSTNLGHLAANLVLLLLRMLAMGINPPGRSQDVAKAAYYRRHGARDVNINWGEMGAETIVALINACNPWNKGAITQLNGKIVRLLEAKALPVYPVLRPCVPGTILALEGNRMIVSTNKNCPLSITLLYLEEGFTSADRLGSLGFAPGHVFNSI